jgi:hypothetical protein
MSKLVGALVVAVATFAVGLLGASAFNPDDGSLLHSELLWRLFGIPSELALVATPALALAVVGVALARSARRLSA